jgi:signal recognition particle receptor subunit beta
MVFFNYALRKLNAKIVYYGPGLCGKTTNLVWVHDHFEGGERGKMISLATEGDRTIFFDLLPLEIGSIRGMEVTLQLYTVPGQVHYNSTRQLVLRGADGVVFVADSQRAMQSSNIDSFKNLQENLLLQGISLDGFPHVLQFNKRDLKDLVPVEELNDELNHYSVPIFEAIATEGVGVQETLEGIVKLVMRNLRQRYEGATTGARTPGVEDSQVSIPEAPPTPPPTPPAAEEPVEPISFDEAPAAAEEPPEPPPVEPPEPEPEELIFEAESEQAEELVPDEPAPQAYVEGDPAETVDFSKASGSDPFGGLGGGFEDEVSTAVYDVDADAAIDFEELKKLDAKRATPPPAPEPAPAERPGGDAAETADVAAPPEVPEAASPAFDLDSTDAGAKTQDAATDREEAAEDSMAAFDFNAPAPEMESIPDFELDEPEPEPPPVEAAPPVEEPAPPVAFDEPSPVAADTPAPEELPVTEDFPPAPDAPPPVVEGRYEDRIEAPSPFAPKPEAPPVAPEAFAEPSGPAEVVAEAPAGPAAEEAPPAQVEAPPPAAAEEAFEAPPAASVVDETFDVPPAAEPPQEGEAPSDAIDEDLFEATPQQPVVVGNDDPWTEEELSGVYDLAEVEKAERAEQAAAIEAAERRPIDVSAADNQIHLRLQGTGAIVESGQVRALDIEVPVPGSWVGNRRVTLQLRLTLIPDTEEDDVGPGSPS